MSSRQKHERPILAPRGGFAVECPGCLESVGVGSELVGRVAGCPHCRVAFVVPNPDGTESPRPAAGDHGPGRRGAEEQVPAAPAAATDRPSLHEAPLVFADPPPPSTRSRGGAGPSLDALSAPAFAAESGVANDQVAIATAPEPDPAPESLSFREPVKTIRSGGTEIELRRIAPEEKRSRQVRRNMLILVVGAASLVALVVVLGSRGR